MSTNLEGEPATYQSGIPSIEPEPAQTLASERGTNKCAQRWIFPLVPLEWGLMAADEAECWHPKRQLGAVFCLSESSDSREFLFPRQLIEPVEFGIKFVRSKVAVTLPSKEVDDCLQLRL